MRRTLLKLAALAAVGAVISGCASGPKYSDMASTIPALKPGEGRVYFLRSQVMFAGAVQPEILLNGKVVGVSRPGGFFFVDRPAGNYTAAVQTETEKTVSFVLQPGETKYVRSSPHVGLVVHRIFLELESPDKARAELPSLSFDPRMVAATPN